MDEPELPDPPTIPMGDIIWIAGGDIDRVNVTLRFFGDDLDPEKVSQQLQCEPTAAQRKGEILPSKRYRRVAKTGSWRLESSKDEVGTLEEKLSRLLDRVSSDKAVWANLCRFKHDLFCGLHLSEWNRGCSISPELMQRISDLNLSLELDIYFEGEPEE